MFNHLLKLSLRCFWKTNFFLTIVIYYLLSFIQIIGENSIGHKSPDY